MRFGAKIIGDVVKDVRRFDRKLARAVSAGVTEAATGLKAELRQQVTSAGMSPRLANTWRSAVYPSGRPSKNAAGVVFSKAPHIIHAYDHGSTIRSKRGRYLAVPLPTVQKYMKVDGRRQRITPEVVARALNQPDGELMLVARPGKNPLLVARGVRVRKSGTLARATVRKATRRMGERVNLDGLAWVPMFVLIPHAQVAKKLDVERAATKWGRQSVKLIDREMGLQG